MRVRITYRPETGLPTETVDADSVARSGGAHLVLRGTVLVMSQPREIVVRRLRAVDVLALDDLDSATSLLG